MKRTIIIMLLFLAACQNSNEPDIMRNIYVGTIGVALDFINNEIPDKVRENEVVYYTIRAQNRGPYELNNARLTISVDPGIMKFPDGSSVMVIDDITLQGKSFFDTFDDFRIRNIPITIQSLDETRAYHDAEILTAFCYDYKGYATANVCIDRNPQGATPVEKTCRTSIVLLSQGQGGPVSIDKIEPYMIVEVINGVELVRPQFKIFVQNRGRGVVFKPGSIAQFCGHGDIDSDVYNNVRLDNIAFSNFNIHDFDCLPGSFVLKGGSDHITCTLKRERALQKDAAYTTPLRVEISYGYKETISKELRIEKILRR
jgi:hypothetical protein